MTTETQTTEPTADDSARRLSVAICNLSVAIVQLRMMVDQVTHNLEKAGHSSIQAQALGSHCCTCEIEVLAVVGIVQQDFLGGSSVAEVAAGSEKENGVKTADAKLLH
jgi:hypothetical protein